MLLFGGEDESQPSTSNGKKLPKTLLDGRGAVNHASVPKKLRSAIKKRGREHITLPLPIRQKNHHMLNGVNKLRKDGTKKSKLTTREGHVTRDEEEVAEALYALAGIFSEAKKADQQVPDHEQPEMRSSSINATEGEQSRKISTKLTPSGASQSSNLVDSTAQIVIGCGEGNIDQVGPSGSQYGKNCNPIADKSECKFECTNVSTQPRIIENITSSEKYTGVAIESKKSWKRCTSHVYISRLIKVLQISDRLTPTKLQPHNQMSLINCKDDSGAQKNPSSGIQNDIFLHKRPVQEQQVASQTSALCSIKQGYNFFSLGTGCRGLENSESVNRAEPSYEPCKQYHMTSSFMQSRDHPSMLFSLPRNGYSSTFNGHSSPQQVPQYESSTFKSSFTEQMEPHQQKWAPRPETHYNTGGGGGPLFPDSASTLNYAHTLFPHLHAALGRQYQQQLSPSQEQVLALNSPSPLSNVKRYQHHLPLGFERNGETAFGSESIQQLQLPCNQYL